MLATHHIKFAQPMIKIGGIQVENYPVVINPYFLSASNINIRQKLWACPTSGAYIRIWKEVAEQVMALKAEGKDSELLNLKHDEDNVIGNKFPEKMDGYAKSVFLPCSFFGKDKVPLENFTYIATTPVPCLGLIHEVFKRNSEQGYKTYLEKKFLQTNHMSLSNHGECLAKQAGIIYTFPFKKPLFNSSQYEKIKENTTNLYDYLHKFDRQDIVKNKKKFLSLKLTVHNANMNSGLIATGLPAVTAIGGFVHTLEREILQNLDFAIGYTDFYTHENTTKYVDQSSASKSLATKGIAKSTRFMYEEKKGNCELILILKLDSNDDESMQNLEDIFRKLRSGKRHIRVAGGDVLNVEINENIIVDKPIFWLYPPRNENSKISNWFVENPKTEIYKFSIEQKEVIKTGEKKSDILDCIFSLYKSENKKGYNEKNEISYGITTHGYSLLGEPQERSGVRTNGHLHCFSEPMFCLTRLDTEFNLARVFWGRTVLKKNIFWE